MRLEVSRVARRAMHRGLLGPDPLGRAVLLFGIEKLEHRDGFFRLVDLPTVSAESALRRRERPVAFFASGRLAWFRMFVGVFCCHRAWGCWEYRGRRSECAPPMPQAPKRGARGRECEVRLGKEQRAECEPLAKPQHGAEIRRAVPQRVGPRRALQPDRKPPRR